MIVNVFSSQLMLALFFDAIRTPSPKPHMPTEF